MPCKTERSLTKIRPGGETVLRGYKAEGGGQVGLAHAGRSEKHHILAVFQEAHDSQFVDLALVDGALTGISPP